MAHVSKANKHHEDHAWIIKGVMYRCKLSVIDWGKDVKDRARFHITVYVLSNDYHKHTAYSVVGECVYNGISLKEAWEEVQSYVGKAKMPVELLELQPFIARQT